MESKAVFFRDSHVLCVMLTCTKAVPYPCEPYPWIELLQLGTKRHLTLEICRWGRHFSKLFLFFSQELLCCGLSKIFWE